MPNKNAQKKHLKQSIKNNLINRSTKKKINTFKKYFLNAIKLKNKSESDKYFIETQSLLAKASKKNILHWKKAARLTSRMHDKYKIFN